MVPQAIELSGYIVMFVTHFRCDARPTVIFPTAEHCHCLYSFPVLPEDWRLNWPKRLVTYQEGIPANGHPVLTRLDVTIESDRI